MDELEPPRPIHDRPGVEHARIIIQALPRLGDDELEAVHDMVIKMLRGSQAYGQLILETDSREFLGEALEEIDDALWYVRFRLMRLRRAK